MADSLQEIVVSHAAEEAKTITQADPNKEDETESPIIRLVDLILVKAIRDRASDIHIEPDETAVRIRYRINGIMREEASPPKSMQK